MSAAFLQSFLQKMTPHRIGLRLGVSIAIAGGLSVVSTIAAITIFNSVQTEYGKFSAEQIPQLEAASQLQLAVQELQQHLLKITTSSNQQQVTENLLNYQNGLKKQTSQINQIVSIQKKEDQQIKETFTKLSENGHLTAKLRIEQIDLENEKQVRIDQLAKLQAKFVQQIEPLSVRAKADLLAASRKISLLNGNNIQELIDTQFIATRQAYVLRSDFYQTLNPQHELNKKDRQEQVNKLIRRLKLESIDPTILNTLPALFSGSLDPEKSQKLITDLDTFFSRKIKESTSKLIEQSEKLTNEASNSVVLLIDQQVKTINTVDQLRGDIFYAINLSNQLYYSSTTDLSKKIATELNQHFNKINLEINSIEGLIQSTNSQLNTLFFDLKKLSVGPTGILNLRLKQINTEGMAELVNSKNAQLLQEQTIEITNLIKNVRENFQKNYENINESLGRGSWWLTTLTLSSIFILFFVCYFYISRNIISRLNRVAQGMIALSNGQHDIAIKTTGEDEIAQMSQALEVFRQSLINEQNHRHELIRARALAEAGARSKSDFLANMSHEIRTPMAAIIGYADLAAKTESFQGNPVSTHIEKIRSAAKSLLVIINDILDFSKIEAGKLEISPIDFSMSELLNNLLDVTKIQADKKKLSIDIVCGDDVPLYLNGDSLRLGQVLLNLFNNAIKFTEHGSVILSIRKLPDLDGKYHYLEFTITDSGIGMNEEQIKKLFQSFNQADSSTTRKYGGTGLGLAISQNLVQLMGGEIKVESAPGVGSIFSFALVLPDAIEPISVSTVEQPSESNTPHPSLNILLVEDTPLLRELSHSILTDLGHRVTTAENGRIAIETVKAHQGQFDLILMDIQMPEVDGYAATQKIFEDYPTLPIMAMTAHALETEKQRSFAAGMIAHLTKPINVSELKFQLAKINPTHPSSTILAQSSRMENELSIDVQPLMATDKSVFDIEPVLKIFGGKVEPTIRILEMTLKQYEHVYMKLMDLIQAKNITEAKRLVHTLKGSIGSVGGKTVSTLAAQLEINIHESTDFNALTDQLTQFELAIHQYFSAVKNWLNCQNSQKNVQATEQAI